VTAGGAGDRLRSLVAEVAGDPALRDIGGRVAAVGWATVELDRGLLELSQALDLAAERFVPATQSPSLGARCLLARDGLEPGVAVILLEPSTEGRLAASLARRGEGPAAIWLEVARPSSTVVDLQRAGVASSVERPGPLGAERLLLGGRIHGPHRLFVERPGTIRA
jgi:hypothetical protein